MWPRNWLGEPHESIVRSRQNSPRYSPRTGRGSSPRSVQRAQPFTRTANGLVVSDARRAELRREFAKMDVDGSGAISLDELASVLEATESSPGERLNREQARSLAKGVIAKFDADGNGELDFDEFIRYEESRAALATKASRATDAPAPAPSVPVESMGDTELRSKLRPVFARFDLDGSGSISTDEMGRACEEIGLSMTRAQLEQMMLDADPDGSGAVDYEEFVVVLKKQMGTGGRFAQLVAGFLNPLSWFMGSSGSRAEVRSVTV